MANHGTTRRRENIAHSHQFGLRVELLASLVNMIKIKTWLSLNFIVASTLALNAQTEKDYYQIIKESIYRDYTGMFREEGGALKYPFMTPGSEEYNDVLWDWDSWLSNIAIRQILLNIGDEELSEEAVRYEQGCVLNFLSFCGIDGWIPINVKRDTDIDKLKPDNIYSTNMHKPCLAQHAAFLVGMSNGDADWLREDFYKLQYFVNNYQYHQRDRATGLYFWNDSRGIGVDNDPSTFYRPPRSSGSIYLNCLMYKELKSMAYLAEQLGYVEISKQYKIDAENLKVAIREHCWDERDGFYYSVDLNLLPIQNERWGQHSGAPRTWDCLIQRIGVWSGFMAMWAGIATPEQAKRMVEEHYNNERTFNAPYGVRSLSKMEKMYNVKASGNPSSWLGPVWGISNYMTWRGLVDYGYEEEARELAIKTVNMFGRDLKKTGVMHEYYEPDTGMPILNPGFKNWNYLVINMIAWLEGEHTVHEF